MKHYKLFILSLNYKTSYKKINYYSNTLTMDSTTETYNQEQKNLMLSKETQEKNSTVKPTKQAKSKVNSAKNDKKKVKNSKITDANGKNTSSKKMDKKPSLKKNGSDEDHFDENDDGSDELADEDDETSDEDNDESPEYVLDEAAYSSLLNSLFPSAYSKNKAEKARKKSTNNSIPTTPTTRSLKNKKEPESTTTTTTKEKGTDVEKVTKETKKTKTNKNKKSKKPTMVIEETEDDEDYEPSTDSETENDDTDDEELEQEIAELFSGKGFQKFNIVLTLGDDEDETDSEEETESEEEYTDEDIDEDDFKNYTTRDYERDIKLLEEFKATNKKMKKEHSDSAFLNFMSDEANYLEKSIKRFQRKSEKKYRIKNMTAFKKITSNKKKFNEKSFFAKRTLDEQSKILAQMEEINAITTVDMPYKFKLLETDIPLQLKACAMKKIEMFKYMDPGMSEYYKLKNWIDTFMEIPFGKYNTLPVSIDDGIDACRDFMTNAKETLDNVAFGLDDAKMQIIQMIGTWVTNPDAIGSAIAIQGPPGTGKTTLVKEGISKILGRDFAFIALGGATDSSYLEGHGYTYEGSKWGKIVDILVQSKSMNPIIYFDELDKISDTPKGEEIAGILTHLTDTTQNSSFHDKYFTEIDFDLSKCLFIFSYNDESKINPILKDRMYRIYTQGYDNKQKQIIAKNYLMPAITKTIKFGDNEITINDDIVDYINMKYVENEKGVRNMKRCLEIVYTKLNLYRFIDSDSSFFTPQGTEHVNNEDKKDKKNKKCKIEFPLTLTRELIDRLLKRDHLQDGYPHLYI